MKRRCTTTLSRMQVVDAVRVFGHHEPNLSRTVERKKEKLQTRPHKGKKLHVAHREIPSSHIPPAMNFSAQKDPKRGDKKARSVALILSHLVTHMRVMLD